MSSRPPGHTGLGDGKLQLTPPRKLSRELFTPLPTVLNCGQRLTADEPDCWKRLPSTTKRPHTAPPLTPENRRNPTFPLT